MVGIAMLAIALTISSVFGMGFWLRFNNPHKVVLGMSYWTGRYYYYTFFPVWLIYLALIGFKFDIMHVLMYASSIGLVWSYFAWKKKNSNEPLQEQARLIPETRIRFILLPNFFIFLSFIPYEIASNYGLI